MRRYLHIAAVGLLFGCVGTDYISDPPVALEPRIVISPDMAALQVGSSLDLAAVYFDETGTQIEGAAVDWSVSDAAIASIDAQGTVLGLRQGQVKIAASLAGTVSDSILVGIVDNSEQIALVQVSPGRLDLEPGESAALTAISLNTLGDTLASAYTWFSSDTAVVRVDAQGSVTALAPGSAEVSAIADGVTSNASRVSVLGAARAGTFIPRPGSRYACEGSAELRPNGNGLEVAFGNDFLVTNGPRLEVFLSPTSEVGPGSINVGPLQNTIGAQAYPLPPGAALDTYNWVIIHCVPFNISFGWAQLQ
jgi:hypothetical protein